MSDFACSDRMKTVKPHKSCFLELISRKNTYYFLWCQCDAGIVEIGGWEGSSLAYVWTHLLFWDGDGNSDGISMLLHVSVPFPTVLKQQMLRCLASDSLAHSTQSLHVVPSLTRVIATLTTSLRLSWLLWWVSPPDNKVDETFES